MSKLRLFGVAALSGLLLTGCVSVNGDARPAHGAGSSVVNGTTLQVQPATKYGWGDLTCYANSQLETFCDTPRVPAVGVPGGTAIMLRQGDPIRVKNEANDRVCSVSFFASSSNGATWAITGHDCAASIGTVVTTYDGYKIGVVDRILEQPSTVTADRFRMGAIKLAPNILVQSSTTGTIAAQPDMIVRAEGATTQQERQLQDNVRELGYTPRTQTPLPQPGDQGAPVVVNGQRLVGVISAVNRVTLIADILATLPTLDPTARLETTS